MNIEQIPIVAVSYNAPDLIEVLLASVRRHYANKIYIIDGSVEECAKPIGAICARHPNVEFIPFGYNIHHGPGMAWAIKNLPLGPQALFLDSDVDLINGGLIETLAAALTPDAWGAGSVHRVDLDGNDRHADGEVLYLHPACMLINLDVVRQWPMPIKHGAPMIPTMLALHQAGKSGLLRHVEAITNDFTKDTQKVFFRHDWMGTVIRTQGYHYDAPSDRNYNPDLLAVMSPKARRIVEVGCNTGGLARAYRTLNPIVNYTGIEIDPAYVDKARPHCDMVHNLNIETIGDEFFEDARDVEHWIFGDVLEHLVDPWRTLARIRKVIPANGSVIACIPNLQHWSVQARIASGNFVYENGGGLLDRTHLRWFTRKTIEAMFQQAGYRVHIAPRDFQAERAAPFVPAIRMMAEALGADPDEAERDARAVQFIVFAVPA